MALCVECRRNKTFERGAKRCSACEAAQEAREARAPGPGTGDSESAAHVAPAVTPGALLAAGVVMQGIGGFVMWGGSTAGAEGAGFLAGVLLAWAGGLALLVALVAFGVQIGIQAADTRRSA